MNILQVGEVAIWQNIVGQESWLNGTETTVVGGLMVRPIRNVNHQCYVTDSVNGKGVQLCAAPGQLRRKPPKQTGEDVILALFKPMPQREGVAA